MDDISLMIDKQKKYKNLKNNVNTIILYLNNAIESLEVPANRISNYYNIDSVSIEKGKLNQIRQELINKSNYLKNVVLVELNKELKELESNVEGM